eukprot:scaffold32856_cov74-Phaeocystis_antarctica.AAC.5
MECESLGLRRSSRQPPYDPSKGIDRRRSSLAPRRLMRAAARQMPAGSGQNMSRLSVRSAAWQPSSLSCRCLRRPAVRARAR